MSAFMHNDSTFHILAAILVRPDSYGQTIIASMRDLDGKLRGCAPYDDAAAGKVLHKAAMDTIATWYAANRNAIAGRYGDRAQADIAPKSPVRRIDPALVGEIAEVSQCRLYVTNMDRPSYVAAVKLLRSLQYQCAEDVAPELQDAHKAACAEMREVAGLIALRVVETMAEYEHAHW